MLEVINLAKVYKSKKGAEVRALDGITLQFPEKGMVFLLGKSGSGKSTLLNVCGGLDAPSGGEIIVKGRSSKAFSQSDFDSYRNTFVGFIFQEYNILNEFTVEDNIALALELQGKPKDKATIQSLLEEVDLSGFAKRKPNTLSGGQKQRIAIARALVKAPEIIMADEPTGALDSNTGKQVFETLKKLSRNKLVIVVSHDRDFAEQYGDRIIELKDGKILSDVTKTQVAQQSLSDNVNAMGDVLCIKRGSELTESDFNKIKAFLKSSNEDVIIANNEKDVKNFKKVSRITEDGQKEVFKDTDISKVEKKEYTKEQSRFIRSKLPAKHAIKIGMSSLKSKPFRLTFTILLCTIAFTLFGMLSTLSFYDSESTFRQSMMDSENKVMSISKQFEVVEHFYSEGKIENEYTYGMDTMFSDSDFDDLKQKFGNEVFGGLHMDTSLNVRSTQSSYWIPRISSFAFLPEDNPLRSNINGNYPQKNDEIVISSYSAQLLINCGTYDAEGNSLDLASENDILNKKLSIGGLQYTVVGIYNSGEISPKYDELKNNDNTSESFTTELLTRDFVNHMNDSLHLVAYTTEDNLKNLAKDYRPYLEDGAYYRSACFSLEKNGDTYVFPEYSSGNYEQFSKLSELGKYIPFDSAKTDLAKNEIIMDSRVFYSTLLDKLQNELRPLEEAGAEIPEWRYQLNNQVDELYMGGTWDPDGNIQPFTEAQKKEKLNNLLSTLKARGYSFKLGFILFSNDLGSTQGELMEFDIVGLIETKNENKNSFVVLHDDLYNTFWEQQKNSLSYYYETTTEYEIDANAFYSALYLPYDGSEELTTYYWDLYNTTEYDEDFSLIRLNGSFVSNLRSIDEMVKSLSEVFLYVGLVLAVFAILLFSNFISVSISQKKREIGILRAVGARSADVFKIFFSESSFIAILCVILSAIGSMVICHFINAELSAEIGASLFVFGPLSLGVLILIAVVTVIAATFLPVYNAARRKPVESIRAL